MSEPTIPDGAANVLVVTDRGDEAFSICAESVSPDTRFLAVSYTRPAREYPERLPVDPAECVVIETSQGGSSAEVEGVTVRSEGPSNFTGIGVRTNEVLTRWHEGADPIVVYFDSITSLLQYADLNTTYRFLHVFTSRIDHADALGVYHLVPGAHDDSTVATLKQLFDTVLTREEDGSYELRRR